MNNKGLLFAGGIGAVILVIYLATKGSGINQISAPQIPLSGASVGNGGFPDLSGTGSQFMIPIIGGSGGTNQGVNSSLLDSSIASFTPRSAGTMAGSNTDIINHTVSPNPGQGGPY
jgi:hypothetical protein